MSLELKRSKTVYKYEIRAGVLEKIPLPYDAKIVHVDSVKDQVFIWVELDPKIVGGVVRQFEFFGTGHPISDSTLR